LRKKVEEKKQPEVVAKPDSDADMGLGLFGSDD